VVSNISFLQLTSPSTHIVILTGYLHIIFCLNRSDPAYVLPLSCPQQSNGYDCGVYVVLFAKYLASALKKLPEDGVFQGDAEQINWDKICVDMGPQGSSWVTPERADEHRKEVYQELYKFLKEKQDNISVDLAGLHI
jgi:Ulp1 protease family, C-terminal catalytic domain